MVRWIGTISLLCILLIAGFKIWEGQNRLSYVPESLSVSKVLYAKEELGGFGPGGNETGVIVYELPDRVAEQIKKTGINYFTGLPPKAGNDHDWHGRYNKWQQTPIRGNPDWLDKAVGQNSASTTSTPQLANYLSKYGFGIAINANLERDINTAISKPGSYFAYGRIGVLIVIPDLRRVVYAYDG